MQHLNQDVGAKWTGMDSGGCAARRIIKINAVLIRVSMENIVS